MFFYKFCFSYLIFVTVAAETIHKDKEKENKYEKLKPNIQRRFIDNLDDKEWHVSHLRDMEFDAEGDCDDTFESKAKKYRETLKRDAALVEYVSADALPQDNKDVFKGKCKNNITDIFKAKEKINIITVLNITNTQRKEKYVSSELNKTRSHNKKDKNDTSSDGEVKTATVSIQLDDKAKNVNMTNKRRSEYQFSSVEYYDEVPDFDHSICPDTVDVIDLELDQLRNYDVECEAILEWRSLE